MAASTVATHSLNGEEYVIDGYRNGIDRPVPHRRRAPVTAEQAHAIERDTPLDASWAVELEATRAEDSSDNPWDNG